MLLRKLPQDSHYQTALRDTLEMDEPAPDADPVFGPWSLANYQLAAVNDGINRLLAGLVGGPMPEPTPRPQAKVRKGSKHDPAAVAYLQAIRDRHRREAGE